MKHFLSLCAFLGLAAISQAATISCVPNGNQIDGTSGSQTEVCNTSALVNANFTNLTVVYQFTVETTPLQTGSTTYSFNGPGNADTSGTVANSGTSPIFTYVVPVSEYALWKVASINILDSYVGTAQVQSGSFGKSITYDLVTSGTPEPSTFIMLGTALTGLGVLARRRKA